MMLAAHSLKQTMVTACDASAKTLLPPFDLLKMVTAVPLLMETIKGWLFDGNTPKWSMKRNACPSAWMIMTAFMLCPLFAGMACGGSWNHITPFHVHHEFNHTMQLWFPQWHRVPPDPDFTHHSWGETKPTASDASTPHLVSARKDTAQVNAAECTHSVALKNVDNEKGGALIDRGANGGIAGGDTKVIARTDRKVHVEGIDKHQITDLPVATCAGVVDTQKGPVVLTMNQCAHVLNSKTTHSSAQMEAHGITVDDRAIRNGGKQHIVTPDGHVMPLQVRSGLVCVDMRPPTSKECRQAHNGGTEGSSPQVTLTSDMVWDPASIDHEHDAEQWFDAMEDLPEMTFDSPFDDCGDYICIKDRERVVAMVELHYNLAEIFVINEQEVTEAAK